LIALLRLRENEVNLRDQTTLLDQDKGAPDSYQQRAATLAASQEKMAGDLDGIHDKTPVPQLDSAFADTSGAMKEVLTCCGSRKPASRPMTPRSKPSIRFPI
jgi:hypothetical protein